MLSVAKRFLLVAVPEAQSLGVDLACAVFDEVLVHGLRISYLGGNLHPKAIPTSTGAITQAIEELLLAVGSLGMFSAETIRIHDVRFEDFVPLQPGESDWFLFHGVRIAELGGKN